MLGIEYLWEHREVDHFLKGPHHLWVDVETNQTTRMWQVGGLWMRTTN